MNSSDCGRPRASLAMYQATGNASSSVHAVATIDITAVRTNVCQYSGSSKKVPVLAQAELVDPRGDARAQRQQRQARRAAARSGPTSHSSAGASSSNSSRRACSAARRVSGVMVAPRSTPRVAGRSRMPPARRHADRRSGRSAAARSRISVRLDDSRSSTAELAPSKSRLSTLAVEARLRRRGNSAASRARQTTSGRTNASTASPAARRPCARACSTRPASLVSVDAIAVDARSRGRQSGCWRRRNRRRTASAARSRAPAACRPARSGRAFITATWSDSTSASDWSCVM